MIVVRIVLLVALSPLLAVGLLARVAVAMVWLGWSTGGDLFRRISS